MKQTSTERQGVRWFCIKLFSASMLCIVASMIGGCMTAAVRLEGGSPFPETPQFSIQPCSYTPEELSRHGLRTDGVYVDMGELSPEKYDPSVIYGYTFYRFWPNGRVMFRAPGIGPLKPSDAEFIDPLRHGSVGYYELTDDGGVKVEVFVPVGMSYDYSRISFSIENNVLWMESYRYPRFHPLWHFADRLGYEFMPVERLTSEPDW